jgi:hypothetical protein
VVQEEEEKDYFFHLRDFGGCCIGWTGRGNRENRTSLRAATHSAEATASLSLCFPRTARKPTGHENDPESVKRRVTICGKKCLFFSMEHKNFIF